MIRDVRAEDAEALASIYNYYITDTTVSFEDTPVDAVAMRLRIDAVLGAGLPWLVIENEARVAGFAYAIPWKPQAGFRHSVESLIYLDPAATGKGIGVMVYNALIARLRGLKIHSAIGRITLPNPASVALHEKLAFRKVAHLEHIGWKFDRWVDMGYWQRLL